jgi:hypothetical protein
VVLTGLAGFPRASRAEESAFAQAQENRVWLDLGAWPNAVSNVFTMQLSAQLRVAPGSLIDLRVSGVAGHLFGDPVDHASVGNVMAGFHHIWNASTPTRDLVLLGGVSFTVPTSYGVPETNEGLGTASILTVAAVSEGLVDDSEFLPELGFARASFGLVLGRAHVLRLRWDLALLVAIPFGSDVRNQRASAGVQSAAEVETPQVAGLRLGVRLALAESPALAAMGLSAGPFIAYEPDNGVVFARVAYLSGSAGLLAWPYDSLPVSTFLARLGVRF